MVLIPHLKFIESLIVCKFSVKQIKEKLEDLSLPFPEEAVAIMVKTLHEEKPEYFRKKSPEPADPDWIRELKIEEAFCYYTPFKFPESPLSMEGPIRLINDPLMYKLLTSMALCLMTDDDIEIIINARYNIEYTSEEIKCFLKYFFDVGKWSLKDRQNYVKTIKDPQLLVSYNLALKGDKEHLLWRLGVSPKKEFKDMLGDMITDSYYNFKEQSKVKPDVAQKWGSLAIRLADKIDSINKEEQGEGKSFMDDFEFNIKYKGDSSPKPVHLDDLEDE